MHTDPTDHGTPATGTNPESIKLGHEPDVIAVRTILYVPVVLLITFALTFVAALAIFNYFRHGPDSRIHSNDAVATERHDVPLNTRLTRVGTRQQDDGVARQVRLDGLERLNFGDQPPYERSYPPLETGNSPQYHPEDLRPDSMHGREIGLQSFSWVSKEKGQIRVPVADVLKILGAGAEKDATGENKKLFQKILKFEDKVNVAALRGHSPKSSNPTWGIPSAEAKPETKGGGH